MKFSFGLNIVRKPGVCSLSQPPAVMIWPANMMATAPPSDAQVEADGCRRTAEVVCGGDGESESEDIR
jgi:hypothetical protein